MVAPVVTIKARGFDEVLKRLRDQRQIIRDPDMSWPVRGVARVWDRNFRGEGNRVGGWVPLRPYTNAVRRRKGFPEEHPILIQTGTLHRVAVRSLIDARGTKSSSGSGVSMTFRTPDKARAHLKLVGEKVKNQSGDRRVRLPSRRFWYVDNEVVSEATKSLQKWYDRELARLG